jgi:hypothetical protein
MLAHEQYPQLLRAPTRMLVLDSDDIRHLLGADRETELDRAPRLVRETLLLEPLENEEHDHEVVSDSSRSDLAPHDIRERDASD